jgi:PAS domain-containing protein
MADHQPLGFDPTSVSGIRDLWNDPTRLIGITETDGTTSRYVDVSPSCEQILGYTRAEILAMRPGDLVDNPGDARHALDGLAGGIPIRTTIGLRHRAGYVVTTVITARLVQIATRRLVISISEPIACRLSPSADAGPADLRGAA